MTTMRVEADNSTPVQQKNLTQKQLTPMEIARIVAECTIIPRASDVRKSLKSFRTRKNHQSNQTEPEKQNTNTPSYQNGRLVKNQSNHIATYASPPMPIHPPLLDHHHRMSTSLVTIIECSNVFSNDGLKRIRHT